MQREERTITLPISGKEAVIRESDGYTERALLKKNKKVFETVPFYLAAMTVSLDGKSPVTKDHIEKLLLPDEEKLLLETYKLTYGEIFEFGYTCPHCNAEQEPAVDLEQLDYRPLAEGLQGPDPTITEKLPRSGMTAVIGMLNVEKQAILLEQMSNGDIDLNQADFLCLRSLDGEPPTYEQVVNLVGRDHKAIRKARKKLVTGYDPNVIITCEACDEKSVVNVLMHPDFLLIG